MIIPEIKPCPFCGGKNIGLSIKTTNCRRKEHKYHVAMYCKDCHCLGSRLLMDLTDKWIDRCNLEKDEDVLFSAVTMWNIRA